MLGVGGGGGIAGYRVQTHNLFTPSFVSRTTEKDHLCGNNLTKRTLSAPERQICTDIVIITSIKLLAVCETTCQHNLHPCITKAQASFFGLFSFVKKTNTEHPQMSPEDEKHHVRLVCFWQHTQKGSVCFGTEEEQGKFAWLPRQHLSTFPSASQQLARRCSAALLPRGMSTHTFPTVVLRISQVARIIKTKRKEANMELCFLQMGDYTNNVSISENLKTQTFSFIVKPSLVLQLHKSMCTT